eukprot:TRINITY_DN15005_c0_g1_i1.p1 TRINITY_DN15005_c0_g1~~TRINITY_DN15005_c0_g1_i1.p1  ORF type:complete len:949 (-),score=248.94 TRINITY_DN15005_c0_g1_i1:47-2893(-)
MASEWTASKVRDTFVKFFVEKQNHTSFGSSPVVPVDDPTLLFANAGMNQFKPIFLGTVDPSSPLAGLKRAANSQKCIRAGGKHNDLEDVGRDTYHHTFFEMLGNWSFADYFKKEAISWAWELMTGVYKLDPARLYVTYFKGNPDSGLPADEECRQMWLQYLPDSHVLPFGMKDNFWEMGETGPCGPCTEMHYDRIGGRDAASMVNMDDPDVIELWNLVFIQFNRDADRSLRPLPHKHVDTGMGLERIVSVLQDKRSNYDTDVFVPLFKAIQNVTGARDYTGKLGAEDPENIDTAYRVVADHIRTLSFSIADGAVPSNDGRGYVLRRVLRRGVRYGKEILGGKEGFFAKLVDAVVENLGVYFPELVAKRDRIVAVITEEEQSFNKTLGKGTEQFRKIAAKCTSGQISGNEAFYLYSTMGFPLDLTELMAREKGLTVDKDGFNVAMKVQQESSRAIVKSAITELKLDVDATSWLDSKNILPTDDSFKFDPSTLSQAKILAIFTGAKGDDAFVQTAQDGQTVGFVLDKTNFYAEAGGQVYDDGELRNGGNSLGVQNVQIAKGFVLHIGVVTGSLSVGDNVTCSVDITRRKLIVPNHTTTHVLNYALRKVLGDEVNQKGSLVQPDKLRFDFSSNAPKPEAVCEVERITREQIERKLPVYVKTCGLADAKKITTLRAVFGEQYPDPVRVVSVGVPVDELLADPTNPRWLEYSVEFCGGTHVQTLAEAETFVLIEEGGISKGVRRITGLTGPAAANAMLVAESVAEQVAALTSVPDCDLEEQMKKVQKEVDAAVISYTVKTQLRVQLDKILSKVKDFNKRVVAEKTDACTKAVTEATKAALAAGEKFCVVVADIGVDSSIANKVYLAVKKALGSVLPLMIISPSPKDGRVLCVAQSESGVPDSNKWVLATVVALLDDGAAAKGGGKPTSAGAQGTRLDRVDAAVAKAKETFASS